MQLLALNEARHVALVGDIEKKVAKPVSSATANVVACSRTTAASGSATNVTADSISLTAWPAQSIMKSLCRHKLWFRLPPGVPGRAELVVGVGLDCRIADVCGGAAELGQHGAGRARRLRLCQGVEHLAKVFINPEMTLAVTQDKPCLGQVL